MVLAILYKNKTQVKRQAISFVGDIVASLPDVVYFDYVTDMLKGAGQLSAINLGHE